MKQLSDKARVREALEREINRYIEAGGAVNEIARGISGQDHMDGTRPSHRFKTFEPRPREERTYVPEVVAAIEARRKRGRDLKKPKVRPPKLVRKAIYDDFGEPIRYEWVEK